MTDMAGYKAKHFRWRAQNGIAVITLDRPERKNPLTFDSYAELRDCFRALAYADDIKAVVFGSNGGNFCSGGDVHDIIGPLLKKDMKAVLEFTRMTGDLVKAMIGCGKPAFAHMMTKTMLIQEWSMSIEQAIEAEAQAQAICMRTADFARAYEAFAAK